MTSKRRHRKTATIQGIVFAILVAIGTPQAAPPDGAPGSLFVESEPPSAAVYVDGRSVGETPLTLSTIPAGVHRIRVVRLGFLENSRLVTIKGGERATLKARLTDPAPQTAQSPPLKIVVLEGENAVNIIQQKTAVAPVIEVRDHNDQPVAGAVVKFAIQKGKASFDGARTLTVTTNAAGRATATGFTATSRGALQIATSAAFQGQTAAISIAQTTVVTAAEASSIASGAGAATGSGGGLSNTAIAGIVGGAGAGVGTLTALRKDAPTISVDPSGMGIQGVTVFTFSFAGGPSGAAWDFGDGSPSVSGGSVTHTFNTAGAFSVTLKANDSNAGTTVTVGNLTGTWIRPVTGGTFRIVMVQTGASLVGQFFVEPLPGASFTAAVSPLDGTVSTPRSVTFFQRGECQRTTNAAVDSNLRTIVGSETTICPSPAQNPTYTRQ